MASRHLRRHGVVATVTAVALSATSALSVSAQSASPYQADINGLDLAFVTAGNASEYQIAQGAWFKELAEAEGATVTVIDGQFDPTVQIAAMDDLIARGVDGILIQMADAVAVAPSIQAARAAGIPVLSVGGTPDASSPVPASVFNDEALVREAARHAGDWVKANTDDGIARIVLFDIPAIIVCHEWRMLAFQDEITNYLGPDNVEVVFSDLVDHQLDVVVAKMEDLIQSGADFNVFTACGGTGAVGGMDALVAAGRGTAVDGVPQTEYVFSIDATPAELAYLVDPTKALKETLALTPKSNAGVFLDTLKGILSGAIAPDSTWVGVAPGVLLPSDCVAVRDLLADQYSVVPGYSALECPAA
jgi:ribose transport system substrate-binding protein